MSDVYGYDEYNDSIAEELHHSLRAGTRQSVGVVHPLPDGVKLFEPMSMREENWAESEVKNALRAGASKSSHAVVCEAVESEEPQAIAFTTEQTPKFSPDLAFTLTGGSPSGGGQPQSVMQRVQMLNFQGSKGNTVVSDDGQSFTLNAMHGHDVHVIAYNIMGAPPREPDRPNGGYYVNETQVTKTLDAFGDGLNPSVNQGGLAIVTRSWPVSFRGRDGGMTAEQGEEGIANTIRAGQGGSVRPHVLISEGPVGTLTTDMGTKMQVNNQSVDSNHLQVFAEIVQDPAGTGTIGTTAGLPAIDMIDKEGNDMTANSNALVVRRLTPLECELLMGWEPGWTEVGITEKGELVEMADTHRYRMCGNGVVSNVAHWIGARYVASKQAAGESVGSW